MDPLGTQALCDIVLSRLAEFGAYVYNAAFTGSIYIKFDDERVRSLRIATHAGRHKYKYKWNLRTDLEDRHTTKDRGAIRFYYPALQVHQLCDHIRNYANKLRCKDKSHTFFYVI